MSICRTRRLKDTCDVCSASKVKCKKQKPVCSRCAKLGLQCCYSPAKRKGRPNPAKRGDKQSNAFNVLDLDSEQQHDGVESGPLSLQAGWPESSGPGTTTNTIPEGTNEGSQDLHDNDYLEDLMLDCLQNTPTGSNSSIMPSIGSFDMSVSVDQPGSPNPHTREFLCSPRANYNGIADASLSGSSSTSNGNVTECSDCGILAVNTLRNLTTTFTRPFSRSCSTPSLTSLSTSPRSSSVAHHDGTALDARMESASAAVKYLSTILACPCSDQVDIGLLNASLCTAILEAYASILEYSTERVEQVPTLNGEVLYGGSIDDNEHFGTISSEKGGSSDMSHTDAVHSGTSGQVIVRRVLEEFPKVADLVVQFARRYKTGADEEKTDEGEEGDIANLLSALTTEQKFRLRTIVDKAIEQ